MKLSAVLERDPDAAKGEYRADIDGLRAVAVLSVLFYHAGIYPFGGGFVGVDVFFVISGFLITRLIRDEILTTGSFSFANFYVRRARRIFPAMLFTIICSFVGAVFFFAPQYLAEFGASVIHALFSVSNVFFWSQVSYFDTAAELKPLLHTWSLSVEEQFYLIWPVLMLASMRFRPRAALVTLIVLGVGSFALNLVFQGGAVTTGGAWPWLDMKLQDGPSAIFYLTPFRVFELAIGGVLVWIVAWKPRSAWLTEVLTALGFGLIAYAVFAFNQNTLFPTYNALIPCLGAALLIYAGEARYLGVLLRNRLAVGIGLVSYSLYLIHWPILVFWRYLSIGELSETAKWEVVAGSIAAAVFMYHFVEQPYRKQKAPPLSFSRPAFGLACTMAALVVLFPAANMWATDGWIWRYPKDLADQFSISAQERDRYVFARRKLLDSAAFANNGKEKVLVVGDSMASDFINELYESRLSDNLDLSAFEVGFPCLPDMAIGKNGLAAAIPNKADECLASLDNIRTAFARQVPDVVVLAGAWRSWAIGDIPATVQFFRQSGARKVVVLGIKAVSMPGDEFLARYAAQPDISAISIPPASWALQINPLVQAAAIKGGAEYYDPLGLTCPDGACHLVSTDRRLIYADNVHLTEDGAHVVGGLVKDQWMPQLFAVPAP